MEEFIECGHHLKKTTSRDMCDPHLVKEKNWTCPKCKWEKNQQSTCHCLQKKQNNNQWALIRKNKNNYQSVWYWKEKKKWKKKINNYAQQKIQWVWLPSCIKQAGGQQRGRTTRISATRESPLSWDDKTMMHSQKNKSTCLAHIKQNNNQWVWLPSCTKQKEENKRGGMTRRSATRESHCGMTKERWDEICNKRVSIIMGWQKKGRMTRRSATRESPSLWDNKRWQWQWAGSSYFAGKNQ